MVATWILTISVILPESTSAQQRGEVGIALGERPELVEIEDLDGNPLKLTDYVGEKPLLLEFYARWCENCEALLPQMIDVYDRYRDRVEFLAISVAVAQSPRSVKRALENHPVDYATVWDEGGRAVRAFLAPATSYIVVLARSGKKGLWTAAPGVPLSPKTMIVVLASTLAGMPAIKRASSESRASRAAA